jgi:hypothetical protein
MAMYFLLSSDFVSESTDSNTLSASTFRMASRTYGCFSVRGKKLAIDIDSIISTNKVSIRVPSE